MTYIYFNFIFLVDEDDTDGKTPNKSMKLDMSAEPTPKIKGDKPEAHNDTPTGRCRSSLASRWLNHAAPRKTSTPDGGKKQELQRKSSDGGL